MPLSKERVYYKAVRQALTAVNSSVPLKGKLSTIARVTSRSFAAGVSILLLDSTHTRLIHTASWKLPQFYLRKGLLDARESLSEVTSGAPVVVEDVAHDSRVQHPEQAFKAGIVSILGMPILSNGQALGTIRIYFKEHYAVTNQDMSFVRTMAQLAAMALCRTELQTRTESTNHITASVAALSGKERPVIFAHPSEEEFARILDFYGIDWIYEPRSFPLERKTERASEMFTPDFYLPALDLYIELTTIKQSQVTYKNRKLRRLKELYPEIRISLLYKNDYDRLLAKYGIGPLAQSRAHGLRRILFPASEINRRVREMASQISQDFGDRRPVLVGVQRGFLCFMADLMRHITVPLDLDFMAISYYSGGPKAGVKVTRDIDLDVAGRHILLVEDIVDTGITLNYMLNYLREKTPASLKVCTLLDRRARRLVDVKLDYVGFEVPDEFVVGYGLDYRNEYRNLPFIAVPEIVEFPPQPES